MQVSSPVIVRKLDELLARQEMVQPLHRHSFYFILVVEKGSGLHTIDFIPYPVRDGDVFILRPGQVHELTLAKEGKGFLVQLADDFFSHADKLTQQNLKAISRTNYYRPSQEKRDRVHSLMGAMAREADQKQPQHELALQLILHLVFIELLRQQTSPRIVADKPSMYSQDRLEAFQDLLANHVTQQKQVSWYARQLHLSSYQLNAITKATLDKTASAVINEYILLEAKRYLLATANQINQIAWHLGFEDVSYFSRYFKKRTGHSSEVFRMKFK